MGSEATPSPENERYKALAEKLMSLQSAENGGMGITCVRGIVHSLERGDLGAARAEAETDGDKIRNYPKIHEVISEELFEGMLPPITYFKGSLDEYVKAKAELKETNKNNI